MLHFTSSWDMQLLLAICISVVYTSFLAWNYHISTISTICKNDDFSPWTKNIVLFLLGGSISQTTVHCFRILVAKFGFSMDGHLRHPKATITLFFVSVVQSSALLLSYFDVFKYSCEDFMGVRTSPFLWLEWLPTVPLMFYCVSMLDVKRQGPKPIDYLIEFLGGFSIISLFVGNILSSSSQFVWFPFLLAHGFMFFAVMMQQYEAWNEYCATQREYNLVKPNVTEAVAKEILDNLQIAKCKLNCNMFITLHFTVFPILYYMKVMGYINVDECYVALLVCSYFSKVLFAQILLDSHIQILDPHKFLLLEEKKQSEESKLMFLRYVFHEVRVPLNSISLGLQLLHDSTNNNSDMETIKMMQEAAHFMTETLNDVLSLQKIEQGMFELEIKPFSPVQMVHAVLNNFRTQYESKKIVVHTFFDGQLPLAILGDQFRLEHVLGNLLSNAIKFSDDESKIEISVFFCQRTAPLDPIPEGGIVADSKPFVTFCVKDHGPGISPEDQTRLFQPFVQIRPGQLQKGKGTGLGLSICKNIIALHNGIIGCRSKLRDLTSEDGGSEFYFAIECTAATLASPSVDSVQSVHEQSRNPTASTESPGIVPESASRIIPGTNVAITPITTLAEAVASGPSIVNLMVETIVAPPTTSPVLTNSASPRLSSSAATTMNGAMSKLARTVSMRNLRTRSRSMSNYVREYLVDSKTGISVPTSLSGSRQELNAEYQSNSMKSHHSTRSSSFSSNFSGNCTPTNEQSCKLSNSTTTTPAHITSTTEIVNNGDNKSNNGHSSIESAPEAIQQPLYILTNTILRSEQPMLNISVLSPIASTSTESTSFSPSASSSLRSQGAFSTKIFAPNILIVDDVLSNRKMLDKVLRNKGFIHNDQCDDGSTALEHIKSKGLGYYDIIFMDSMMPIMCGPEAATTLRTLGFQKLIIGVTGNALDVDVIAFEQAGVDCVIPKPVQIEILSNVFEFCRKEGYVSYHFDHTLPLNKRIKSKLFPSSS